MVNQFILILVEKTASFYWYLEGPNSREFYFKGNKNMRRRRFVKLSPRLNKTMEISAC